MGRQFNAEHTGMAPVESVTLQRVILTASTEVRILTRLQILGCLQQHSKSFRNKDPNVHPVYFNKDVDKLNKLAYN